MGYGIVLRMDEGMDARFRGLWQALANADITSIMLTYNEPPHLTLGILETLPPDFEARLAEWAAGTPAVETKLSAVSTFPGEKGVVFVAPTVNQAMLTLHRSFHDWLTELGLTSQGYRPDTWHAHCTIGVELSPEQIMAAVDMCRESDVFGPVRFESVELFQFFPVQSMCRWALNPA